LKKFWKVLFVCPKRGKPLHRLTLYLVSTTGDPEEPKFWKVLFVCLLAVVSVGLVKGFYEIGLRGGFEWGLRSVAPTFEEKPAEI
jgi:hypothetical protein